MLNVYPEDEFALFAPPIINTVQLPTQPLQLSVPDVRRVAVIFSGYGMAATDYFRIAPVNVSSLSASVVLTTQNATLSYTWRDYGPFVQSGWRIDGVGSGFLTITAISLMGHPALYGYPDLFTGRTGRSVNEGAAPRRRNLVVPSRRSARPLNSLERRILRQVMPNYYDGEG